MQPHLLINGVRNCLLNNTAEPPRHPILPEGLDDPGASQAIFVPTFSFCQCAPRVANKDTKSELDPMIATLSLMRGQKAVLRVCRSRRLCIEGNDIESSPRECLQETDGICACLGDRANRKSTFGRNLRSTALRTRNTMILGSAVSHLSAPHDFLQRFSWGRSCSRCHRRVDSSQNAKTGPVRQ